MAATSLSSSPSKVGTAKLGGISRSSPSYTQLAFCSRHAFHKIGTAAAPLRPQNELKHARPCATTDNDRAAPAEAQESATISARVNPVASGNGQQPQPGEPPKRVPLTARERLRAARVLGKYAEPGAGAAPADKKGSSSKPEFGSRVLDALRETDGGKKGGRKRSGLPEAPSNLLDDTKRGMPKDGWTFDWLAALPVGTDVLIVAASFGIITTVMFGTTYLVWKLGAIHFNEY
ncbi:uncharacterized protein [Aegilops tauschii subsp. strangulata]|uniref:uncharacterized protein n=1 Tax=Aegilops tauschii subsp. strangulata TaxID=200361 RepID=UPI00098B94C6|nr:uncharacterized protein LOC109733435 [Aegilops tauschii subsp. strangulata]